jgi:hypothetical protein
MGIICNFIYNTLVKNLRTYSLCPLFKYRYGIRAGQTFLSLTRFIENSRNICISKEVYYENRFNDLSNDTNDTNYVPININIFLYNWSKLSTFDFSGSENNS